MKRYIVFVGTRYYPDGCDDIVAVTTDIALAMSIAADKLKTSDTPSHAWAEIYDIQSETVVWTNSED